MIIMIEKIEKLVCLVSAEPMRGLTGICLSVGWSQNIGNNYKSYKKGYFTKLKLCISKIVVWFYCTVYSLSCVMNYNKTLMTGLKL